MADFKKEIHSNTIIIGGFNTPLSKMDRSSKQNIKKDIVSLNNTLDEMDLTDRPKIASLMLSPILPDEDLISVLALPEMES